MGLWDEAEEQRRWAVEAQRRHRAKQDEEYNARVSAVAEFIDAMKRLRIPPREHRFQQRQSGGYGRTDIYKDTGFSIVGWDVENPRGTGSYRNAVITPDGCVYELRCSAVPRDLREFQYFNEYNYNTSDGGGDFIPTLRNGLANAMQGC